MGKISQGILGGISGKIGNVVGANWKGIDYLRIKPSNVANPRTVGQVNQRNKFSATLAFLKPNLSFINVGYKNLAVKKTPFNVAMSYILNNAITGVEPDFEVDYAQALLSRGVLAVPANATNDLSVAGEVNFSWDDNSAGDTANATDKSMVLVFNPTKKESIYMLQGATREIGSQTLQIPDSYSGDSIEMYMAFVSEDGKKVSNSIYLGSGTAS